MDKRAIVTVIGVDKVGIIAHVGNVLSAVDINILDISQTVMQQYFTMIMLVDYSLCSMDFKDIKEHLKSAGNEIGMKINIQREAIFDAMHKI
ncbi:MAG: ACT domain-containing protein [Clostridia bacterium]|nr:ACT domain-containing protein [Clostridia bacterium]